MTPDSTICDIEQLFPVDSDFEKTNAVGRTLLMQAIEEYGWRNLPIDLLHIYRDLCIRENTRQTREYMRKINDKY